MADTGPMSHPQTSYPPTAHPQTGDPRTGPDAGHPDPDVGPAPSSSSTPASAPAATPEPSLLASLATSPGTPARRRALPGTGARIAAGAAVVVVAAVGFGLTRDGAGAGSGEQLTWAPPRLTDPTVVEVSADNRSLELEPDTDYVVEMPDEPLEVQGGLVINGGRNVVLVGGEIRIPERGERDTDMRGLYLQNQTGTLHIEGLLISGAELAEGINLDQREGATVQLQNVRVDTVRGEEEGHHADVIQTWAGPSVLRIDRMTGSTTYQGFFLLPKQFMAEDPELFDLRNINLVGQDGAGYLLWRDEDDWPLTVENVWVDVDGDAEDRDSFLWARGDATPDTWDDVQVGTPPGGDFVPADRVGVGYRSPGYVGSDD